jgi:hypothetical protein
VNLGSQSTRGLYRLPYATSKGGILALTKVMAMEYGRYGIRINAMAPGGTEISDRVVPRQFIKPGVMVDEPEALADLLSVLPGGERDAAAADLIRWVPGRSELLRVLERVPGPWTGPLAATVVATLTASAERPTQRDEHLVAQLCRLADQRLDPAAASRLDLGDAAPRAVTELINTLSFRDEMLKELTS